MNRCKGEPSYTARSLPRSSNLQGNDLIEGGDGDDVLHGQRGDDGR